MDYDCDGLPSICRCNPFPKDFDGDVDWIYPGADEGACPDGTDQNCDGVDGDPDLICNGMAEPVDPPANMSA